MATVVNTSTPDTGANSTGTLAIVLVVLLVVGLLIFYGIPALQSAARPASPTISVPDKIDVNVKPAQ